MVLKRLFQNAIGSRGFRLPADPLAVVQRRPDAPAISSGDRSASRAAPRRLTRTGLPDSGVRAIHIRRKEDGPARSPGTRTGEGAGLVTPPAPGQGFRAASRCAPG
jgi:hypothetical protein